MFVIVTVQTCTPMRLPKGTVVHTAKYRPPPFRRRMQSNVFVGDRFGGWPSLCPARIDGIRHRLKTIGVIPFPCFSTYLDLRCGATTFSAAQCKQHQLLVHDWIRSCTPLPRLGMPFACIKQQLCAVPTVLCQVIHLSLLKRHQSHASMKLHCFRLRWCFPSR